MEIKIWKLLTFTTQTEAEDLSSVRHEYGNYLKERLKKILQSVKYLHSTGEKYTCSYIFFFRTIILDQSLFFEVCMSMSLYYVYQLNI